ncbi:MAG TPA: protein-L-isoaspartate(D-aspartate) O-methyltransferase [Candidatus Mcinerneyibacteriales bacterium]|nr:protein-L-isoaspartate(D-aspartate) O-methyltransferase [Candidatus Mcinerneyibacteriales bacterium]HPE20409.1 protein-L-isoaspartate(D-aspartate) O-methyltransferase [Candidatus Mcinerneyibacteriales bacterium]HPJ70680.1 protein-L-isoaspartate(D-aspartate) O-methyltransferase [Candidatus Mcinerneyibacteriales bacterium]
MDTSRPADRRKLKEYEKLRHRMVEEQLISRGIRDPLVLRAFRIVPREFFVPSFLKNSAYKDAPLPIGRGQTISQPYIVARMMEMLELSGVERVLEVGTGSGYQTALLSHCCDVLYSIDRIEAFVKKARKALDSIGLFKPFLYTGDGSLGYPSKAPYDRIIVSAAAPLLPRPLLDQLAEGGVLVMPVGDEWGQQLVRAVRKKGEIIVEKNEGCLFVPLIGEGGWKEP